MGIKFISPRLLYCQKVAADLLVVPLRTETDVGADTCLSINPVPSTALGPQDQTPAPKIELIPSAVWDQIFVKCLCVFNEMCDAISK